VAPKLADTAEQIRKILTAGEGAYALGATSRAIEQHMANMRYPVLQDHWLDQIATLGTKQIVGSATLKQISDIVESYAAPNLNALLATTLGEVSTKTFRAALDASFGRLTSIINNATSTALIDWISRFEDRAEREADAHVRRRGWWTLPSWTSEQLFLFGDYAETDGKTAFTARLCSLYRKNRLQLLRRMVVNWMDLPSFRDRRPIILEALTCHRDRRYRVAVPALLPLVEGIVRDEFPLPPRKSIPSAVRSLLENVSEIADLEMAATLAALDALYQDYRRKTMPRRSRRLNRHSILHGHALSYGSEGNSLRVFAILDLVHSQALTRRRLTKAA
jgi:lambda repressor-like predicted transcriptional regulator